MRIFRRELARLTTAPEGRRWIYVPYDQLTRDIGPLSREPAEELGVVLVESADKAGRRPYHKQKLALVLANQRRFALELAAEGVAVHYVASEAPYAESLETAARELGPMRVMRPAERELRRELAPLFDDGILEEIEHEGWLTSREAFDASATKAGGWRMDAFYRRVRRATGLLMEDGEPAGGKWSFDADNRKPWRGSPSAPALPTFDPDPIKEEVLGLVRERFADHPGELDGASLPTTAADAERQWRWALEECLEHFGPYEDAMSTRSSNLFHTRVSALLNLHRLLPRRLVDDVAAADIPLGSKEGFVRQVLGWREFVRHVHEATDGFREACDAPGSVLPSRMSLPDVFWGGTPSGLHCLDRVVDDVWREAYGHHITRLMILGNLATLIGADAREVSDWFRVAYSDAYDWVVEPNVLGMATFAVGPLLTTKPYVSGAAYIARMSDYCSSCTFDPKKDCPITSLYWAFLDRHHETLTSVARMGLPLRSLAKRAEEQRARDRRVASLVEEHLREGRPVTPEDL